MTFDFFIVPANDIFLLLISGIMKKYVKSEILYVSKLDFSVSTNPNLVFGHTTRGESYDQILDLL